jgi:hypothetical protein
MISDVVPGQVMLDEFTGVFSMTAYNVGTGGKRRIEVVAKASYAAPGQVPRRYEATGHWDVHLLQTRSDVAVHWATMYSSAAHCVQLRQTAFLTTVQGPSHHWLEAQSVVLVHLMQDGFELSVHVPLKYSSALQSDKVVQFAQTALAVAEHVCTAYCEEVQSVHKLQEGLKFHAHDPAR